MDKVGLYVHVPNALFSAQKKGLLSELPEEDDEVTFGEHFILIYSVNQYHLQYRSSCFAGALYMPRKLYIAIGLEGSETSGIQCLEFN